MRSRWNWSIPTALLASGVFLIVDLAFFSANLLKIADGGWLPLSFGAIVFIVMTTWRAGTAAALRKQIAMSLTPAQFRDRLRRRKVARVPGTAIYLSRMSDRVPPQILQHTKWAERE